MLFSSASGEHFKCRIFDQKFLRILDGTVETRYKNWSTMLLGFELNILPLSRTKFSVTKS